MAFVVGPGFATRGRGGMTRTKALVSLVAVSLMAVLLASVIAGQAQEGTAKRQSFGGASVAVVAPPDVTDVAWGLDPANSALVTSATLKFATSMPADFIVCVQVTGGLTILANGCDTTGALSANTAFPVNFDSNPNQTAPAADITGVSVTVTAPVAAVDAPNGVQVTDVDWQLQDTDTTNVAVVTVTFAPFGTGTTSITVRLTLKDPAGVLLARQTLDHDLESGPTTLTWPLPPPEFLAVSAQAIVRLDIQVRLDDS